MAQNTGSARKQSATRTGQMRPNRLPVVVVGAGPYGLAAAAHLRNSGAPLRAFGDPMRGWYAHMPKGMYLKSVPAASSISTPVPGHSLQDFRAARGASEAGDLYAIPVEEFIEYGRWFQERQVPDLERATVSGVSTVDGGFGITLDSGEEFVAGDVVIATGLVPFAHRPAQVRGLTELGRASHTCEYRDLSRFRGQRVAVLGAGQSGLESAALLHEAGASPTVIARASDVPFGDPPQMDRLGERPRMTRLLKPASVLGPGWSLLACSKGGRVYRHLPEAVRFHLLHTVLGPSGAWWLRRRVEGHIPVLCGRRVRTARPDGEAVRVELATQEGTTEVLETDHVLVATGYRVDLNRIEPLELALRQSVRTFQGAPRLSAGFESSVPGLYFTSLAAAPTFGPVLRFVAGTGFASRRVTAAIAARSLR